MQHLNNVTGSFPESINDEKSRITFCLISYEKECFVL